MTPQMASMISFETGAMGLSTSVPLTVENLVSAQLLYAKRSVNNERALKTKKISFLFLTRHPHPLTLHSRERVENSPGRPSSDRGLAWQSPVFPFGTSL